MMAGMTMSRRWQGPVWVLSLLLVAAPALAGVAEVRRQVEASMLVTGSIEVGTNGAVTGYTLKQPDQLPEYVRGLIADSLPTWKFLIAPQGRDVTAPVRAPMTLRVVASQNGDGTMRIRIASASFDDDRDLPEQERLRGQNLARPRYPREAELVGASGVVYVAVKVGRDGMVEDAAIERVNMTVVASEGDLQTWRQQLSRTTLQAARRWRFQVPVAGPGKDKPYWTVRVPVQYEFFGSKHYGYGQWVPYVPGPVQKTPWPQDGDGAAANDAQVPGTLQLLGNHGLTLLTPLDAG